VSNRPLVLVSGLTVGDYLLWNWSLNSNHDALALVSGLTLPPLAVVLLWLLALTLARLIARLGRRGRDAAARELARAQRAAAAAPVPEEPPTTAPATGSSSRKLAA
jgi:hypothetical protein